MSVVALPTLVSAPTDDGLLKQRVHRRLVTQGVEQGRAGIGQEFDRVAVHHG